MHGKGSEALPTGLVEALLRAKAYPADASRRAGIQHVQTHLSHVFLTGERVYKLRKPVALGFVDFTLRSERNADCVRELELNRRLAPDVYLGVAPLEPTAGGFRVARLDPQPGPALARSPREHCVVMRRLAAGRDALTLLEAGRLHAHHLDAIAACVASFHDTHGLGVPAPFGAEAWQERIAAPVAANLELLSRSPEDLVPAGLLERLGEGTRRFLETHADRLERRRRDGRAVDGHGDLHLQHIWFEKDDSPPLLIDCIEFREDLRRIDAASEIAFLAMDLRYRRAAELAERFVRAYALERDDFDLYGVLGYYESYRAAVRAKVAAIAASEEEISAEQRRAARGSVERHLELAAECLAAPARGGLVAMSGIVGTGKSWAAARLADALGGVVIASDRLRKRIAGLSPLERGGAASGLYDEAMTERVYRGMLARAEPVVASGRFAILDATFSRAPHRRDARGWAEQHGVPFRLVETRSSEPVALERLGRRRTEGRDPSDAGPDFYARSKACFDPVEATAEEHRVLRTDRPGVEEATRALAEELRALNRPPDPGLAKPRGMS